MGFSFKLDCIAFKCDLIVSNWLLKTWPNNSLTEFFIKFKGSASHDLFKATATPLPSTYPSPYPEDVLMSLGTGKASQVLGQMTAYAMLIMGTQYRTHTFSVLIVKDIARLLQWDCSGAVITKPFPYNNESYLFDFLFHYNHAGPNKHGHDVTVRDSTNTEQQDAQTIVDELKDVEHLVTVSMLQQDYVICAPCAQAEIPVGRWTQTSVTYHCQEKQHVFFKDSWQVLHPDVTLEGDIYFMLRVTVLLLLGQHWVKRSLCDLRLGSG